MSGRDARGFTLMEIIVILGVVAILAAVLAPMVVRYLEDANKAKAESDVRQIAAAILKFSRDTGRFPYYQSGGATGTTPDFEVLKGPGTYPALGTSNWPQDTSADVDTLDNQLQRNGPAYVTTGRFAWRGPYLDALSEDPWGRSYLANVGKLQPGQNSQVWVISAGPNGVVDTPFATSSTAGAALSGDDIGARIQ